MPRTWPSAGAVYVVLIVYAAACLGAFVLALAFKLLQFYRNELLRQDDVRTARFEEDSDEEGHTSRHIYHRRRERSPRPPVYQGLLSLVQYFLGVCLVLIFISCNVPLCICAVLGGLLGIVINKWKRRRRRLSSASLQRRDHLH